jgi:hypothetical protein
VAVIAPDPISSRNLYVEALDLPLWGEGDGYYHSEQIAGCKSFRIWPLSQAAQACFGTDQRPDVERHAHHAKCQPSRSDPKRGPVIVPPAVSVTTRNRVTVERIVDVKFATRDVLRWGEPFLAGWCHAAVSTDDVASC